MAEIVNVMYVAADGVEYPLQAERLTRIKTANYHNWTFEPQTINKRYGVKVLRFGKSPTSYETRLYFGGSVADRKTRIDAFHNAIEKDIRNNKTGRLVWGNWYIWCFVRSSSTYPDGDITVNDIDIWCPYPFWIEPAIFNFYPAGGEGGASAWLDYPYDYEYDFTPADAGHGYVINNAPSGAQFRLTFYGPAVNPYVYIGETKYGVNLTLSQGERIVINSLGGTIERYMTGGTVVNVFNDRDKSGASIFTPIPSGTSNVIWSGEFGMEILIYQERSEPAWN